MSHLLLRWFRFTGAAACLLIASAAAASPLYHANSIHYISTIFPPGSAAGDFDGDGHLDFALISGNTSAVQTARGHGDGQFDPIQEVFSVVSGDPTAADLNGDGIDDLVVSGWNNVSIRYGTGAGLGSEVMLYPTQSAYIRNVAVADLNGDGRLDLVTGITDVIVRLATGPMSYGPDLVSAVASGAHLVNVTSGDIDEDGKLDLLVITSTNPDNYPSNLEWMKGNGDGTFGPPSATILSSAYNLFLADLNGDHHLDVVGDEEWSAGDGLGNFGPAIAFPDPVDVQAVGDLTGDGIPDIIATAYVANGLNADAFNAYRGDGAGGFTRTWSVPIASFEHVSLGDFNDDGLTDALAPDGFLGNVSVHLSNGDGTFGGERHYMTGNRPSGIVLSEATGDARLDAITSNLGDGTVSVLPGLAGGQFGPPVNYPVGASPTAVAVGDLNGDGRADVISADAVPNAVSVLLGLAGGGLAPAVSTPTGGLAPVALALGDLDRDGNLDVVVANQASNNLSILRGNGAGGLAAGPSAATSLFPVAVAVGDLDGDLWPDVAVVTGDRSKASFLDVLRGNGSGGLLPKVSYQFSSGGGRGVGIADVSGDGIPDALAISRNFVTVYLGTGGGALSPLPSFRVGQDRGVVILDADGDGKLDLFIGGQENNCAWFVRGLGGGTFAVPEGYGTDRGPTGLAVSDLDSDGTLDLVVADGDTNRVSVLLGVSPGPVPALATLVSAEATSNGVHIEWLAGAGLVAGVDRSENSGAWARVGQVFADASGRLTFEDREVRAGADYVYRLAIHQGEGEVFAGLVSVRVPSGQTLALAASPNPALGSLGASFSLPDARPARIELYDVSGRRLLSREVGAMGPGAHVLRLDETSSLSSGLYWMRLVHPARTLIARAALVH